MSYRQRQTIRIQNHQTSVADTSFRGYSKPHLPMLLNSSTFHLPFPVQACNYASKENAISVVEIPPNALRRKLNPQWRGGFSLGVDLGMSRTGVAISKGFNFRPLTVLELRGQKLEMQLLKIAEQKEADEFIVGLPKSSDGKETAQSNKVRSIVGRLAVSAAERGWRVYLQDEHGTTYEASNHMICKGLTKSAREKSIDAYSAVMVLERYYAMSGQGAELVLPKNLELQQKILIGPPEDPDFVP